MGDKIYDYAGEVQEAVTELKKSMFAMGELRDNYFNYDYDLDAHKAMKWGCSTGEQHADCTEEDEMSWLLLYDYKKIGTLVNIADDYVFNCLKILEKIFSELEKAV